MASFLWKLSGPSLSLKKGFINWVPWTRDFACDGKLKVESFGFFKVIAWVASGF